jgi:hypothetical protein
MPADLAILPTALDHGLPLKHNMQYPIQESIPPMSRTMTAAMLATAILVTSPCGNAAEAPWEMQASMVEDGDLLLETVMTEEERNFVRQSVTRAKAAIVEAYGDQRAPPSQIIWCKTAACGTYFGGPTARSFATTGGPNGHGGQHDFSRPAIVLLRQVRTRPGGELLAVETLTHEMSHREFQVRLKRQHVPAWFNEGVATYLGKEHKCEPGAKGIDDLYALREASAWRDYTNGGDAVLVGTYCQARNEVAAWIDAHGGFKAVVSLLKRMSAGRSFDDLYTPVPAVRAETTVGTL